MMGYAFCYGACINCGRLFTFNPMRVPSVVINGSREPVCWHCMDLANQRRQQHGLDPLMIAADAYEACDENEMYE